MTELQKFEFHSQSKAKMPKRTRADGDVMDDDPALAGSENGGDGGARSEKKK